MTNKFIFSIAAAFFSVFLLGVATVVLIGNTTNQTVVLSVPAVKAEPPSKPDSASTSILQVEQVPPQMSLASANEVTTASPTLSLVATQTPVLNSDLDALAAAVKLGQVNSSDVDKGTWAAQVPHAQKLLQGLCDCDQRNWLKHFVATGNEALSGSQDYYQSVQLLAKLRRSNQDLAADQAAGRH